MALHRQLVGAARSCWILIGMLMILSSSSDVFYGSAFQAVVIGTVKSSPFRNLDEGSKRPSQNHLYEWNKRSLKPKLRLFPTEGESDGTTQARQQHQQVVNNDVDGIRRRQLLFSMLYGSAALATSVSAAANADDQVVEAEPPVATSAVKNEKVDILKPPLDDREYLTYTLENGLRVLLCSDPSTNEAAAAMDVHVGACSDPVNVPGMAHFAGKYMQSPPCEQNV